MTAFFCWVFVVVEHPWAVRASTVGISLSATVSIFSGRVYKHIVLTNLAGNVGRTVRMDSRDIRDQRYVFSSAVPVVQRF